MGLLTADRATCPWRQRVGRLGRRSNTLKPPPPALRSVHGRVHEVPGNDGPGGAGFAADADHVVHQGRGDVDDAGVADELEAEIHWDRSASSAPLRPFPPPSSAEGTAVSRVSSKRVRIEAPAHGATPSRRCSDSLRPNILRDAFHQRGNLQSQPSGSLGNTIGHRLGPDAILRQGPVVLADQRCQAGRKQVERNLPAEVASPPRKPRQSAW